jgi:protein-ribulosamine 3-kinase
MASHSWKAVAASIARATAEPFQVDHAHPVGGGCINQGFHLQGSGREFFVKLNTASALPMFEAEAAGLEEIAATKTVRVPLPICTGNNRERAWLVLQYLPLSNGGPHAMALLGERLAAMHRTARERFGWKRDNTIGSTPQVNAQLSHWGEFWTRHRLGYQLDLAARNGHRGELQRKGGLLLERIPHLLAGHRPIASLLHGDLWGGNAGATTDNEPVIFDPAVYYGDREVDLAMTMLFGGFSSEFYLAYESAWPLDSGHRERRDLYNLYHVLNHLNLFGSSYLRKAQEMIDGLLAVA